MELNKKVVLSSRSVLKVVSNVEFMLLCLVVIANAWPELRVSWRGFEIDFINEQGSVFGVAGYPRLVELLCIAFVAVHAIFVYREWKYVRVLPVAGLFLIIITAVRIYHGGGWDQLRSGFAIPILLFLALASYKMTHGKFILFVSLFITVSILSGLIILFQPLLVFELPISPVYRGDVSVAFRYAGLGQGYAYQSAYLLIGLSLSLAMIFQMENKFLRVLSAINIPIGLIAVIMAGARTGYVAAIVLIALSVWLNLKIGKMKLIPVILAIIMTIVILQFSDIAGSAMETLLWRSNIEDSRIDSWVPAINVATEWPIIGVPDYFTAAESLGLNPPAHEQNGFLGIIIFAGVPALIVYVAFWRGIIKYTNFLRKYRYSVECAMWHALIYSISVYVVFLMTELVNTSVQVQLQMFILSGLVYCIGRSVRFNYELWHRT